MEVTVAPRARPVCGVKLKASGVESGVTLKVAVTLRASDMLTVQEPVPEQAPEKPAKVEPAAAVAVRLTVVPEAKLAEQVVPQSMPAGLLLTEPLPVPLRATVRV